MFSLSFTCYPHVYNGKVGLFINEYPRQLQICSKLILLTKRMWLYRSFQYMKPATTEPGSLAETVSMAPSVLKKTFVDQWGGQGLETLDLGLPGCMLEFVIRPAQRGIILFLCLTMYPRLHPWQHRLHLHHLAAFPSVSLLYVFLSLSLLSPSTAPVP